jgi:hypothetical protein
MIARESPLRRLPTGIDPKQALFLDGIRHAAEIADLALRRLDAQLTELAMAHAQSQERSNFTGPFLDAWAFVDAVDRLRSLFHLLPGATRTPRKDGGPSFQVFTEGIRNLRNVGDHLAQRADYVVARQGSALGQLSWLTVQDAETGTILGCVIIPGTLVNKNAYRLPNPADSERLRVPTDRITLAAGEYAVCLNDVMPEVERVVRNIENSLAAWMEVSGNDEKAAGTDLLVVATMQMQQG